MSDAAINPFESTPGNPPSSGPMAPTPGPEDRTGALGNPAFLAAERAVAVLHQIAKEAAWLRHLGARLATDEEPRHRVRDAERVRAMATSILDASQAYMRAASRADERSKPIPLSTVLGRATTAYDRIHPARSVVQVASPGLAARAVPADLEAVLLSLLDNAALAMKAMPRSEGPSIEVCAHPVESQRLVVTVKDRGRGMTPDVLDRCCEAGFTTRGSGVGNGVGLSVARETTLKLGGSFEIRSVVGVGTEVELSVPVAG